MENWNVIHDNISKLRILKTLKYPKNIRCLDQAKIFYQNTLFTRNILRIQRIIFCERTKY